MNKKYTIIYLVLFLLGALILSACGQSTDDIEDAVNDVVEGAGDEVQEAVDAVEEAAEEVMEEVEEAMEDVEGSIWVLLPDSASSARWETDDRRFFEEAFDAAGVEYNIVNAEGDAQTQQAQAEQAITAGAKVILIVNLDSGSAAAIIANARDADVAVIDYDRLTVEGPGADVYVSFDNVQVGRTMGEVLTPLIDGQDGTPRVVTLNGGPTDNNATLFRDGYYEFAQPKFDDGSWELVDDQWVPGWDNQEALVVFEQILTAAEGNVSAVFAANDGLANAVISAFKNAGISPAEAGIPISGQDATVGGMQNVLAGDQAMSVYKPIRAEAAAAAEAAILLLQGGDIADLTGGLTINNGTNDIPFIALDPIGVTKDNIMDTVIADGFRTLEEICVGDFEQYCDDLQAGGEVLNEDVAEEFDVNITVWADDTRAPILVDLAEDFGAEYGVGLIVEQVADIRDQFVIAAPAGEGPDIILGAHDWLGQLVDSGLLAPMDLGDKAGSFTDVALTGFTYNSELYGMPYATENLAFFYNTDLVDAAPASWAEVLEVGGQLQSDGDVTYAMGLTGTTYDMFPLQTAFGGYVFGRDADGNYNPGDVGIDSEGMIAAGDFIQQAVADGLISDSTDWDTNHVLFESGEVPFLMAGPWALDRLRESGVPYGIANFPDGGAPFAGVQGFMVNAFSENVLLAQAFLTEFVATDEVMEALYLSGNRPSAFSSVLAATDDADLAAFGEAGAEAILMPAIPEMGAVWASWGDAFSLILTQEQSAEEALTVGAGQIRDLIGGSAQGMVNVPGSWQAASGACDGDWDPACEGSALSDNGDGTFSATFELPAGDYEVKVALNGTWDENYGVDGASDGDNYMFTMDADGSVTFTFDSDSKLLTIDMN